MFSTRGLSSAALRNLPSRDRERRARGNDALRAESVETGGPP
jgi:hypothetical protein